MRELKTDLCASSMHKVADSIKSRKKFNQGSIKLTTNLKEKY